MTSPTPLPRNSGCLRSKALLAVLVMALPGGAPAGQPTAGTVVLIHGLGRTNRSMWALEREAKRRGYAAINWRYASTQGTVAEHAASLHRELSTRLQHSPGPVHFVTHSLGGIVLRAYLGRHTLSNIGRVVMLAPPNQGSEVADQLADWWGFQWLLGPAGQELRTDSARGPIRYAPVAAEVGIIAGSRSTNPVFSRWIGGPNDGKVAVARARLDGMRDFLVVPYPHALLAWQREVLQQTFAFLVDGAFTRKGQP